MKNGRENIISQIIYFVIAMILFGVLFWLTFPDRQGELERTTFPVVVMGDSIVGQNRDKSSVPGQLEEFLGTPVYNGAFGGTCLAMQRDVDDNYTSDMLNMVSLSKAIAADDFGVQQTVRSRKEITDYFGYVVDELECVDFNQVEVLVIAFGINDYHASIPLDNEQNPMDEFTFGGALRSILTTIQKRYPDMKIVLATPTYAWYRGQNLTCEEYNTGSAYLEEYVEKEIEIAEEYDVKVVDLYHNVYPHEKWEDWAIYTEDGVHPNEQGRVLLAEKLAEAIKELGEE